MSEAFTSCVLLLATLLTAFLFLTFTVGAWCIGVYQIFYWVLAQ